MLKNISSLLILILLLASFSKQLVTPPPHHPASGTFQAPSSYDEEEERVELNNPGGTPKNHVIHRRSTTGSVDDDNSRMVVELLIVCDKDFGDIFGQDQVKIFNYFTLYFWDVNVRFKTLTHVNLEIHIVGIIVAANSTQQSYIEESRGEDGKLNHYRILDKFSKWIYRQSEEEEEDEGSDENDNYYLPHFDIAMSVSNGPQEFSGGLSHGSQVCVVNRIEGKNYNTFSINDAGNWDSVMNTAHEIGHLLGAPHDDDADRFLGDPAGICPERGYIMSGGSDKLRWFFSSCSDRMISKVVNSSSADCLRTILEWPTFSPLQIKNVKAPSILDQCKILTKDPDAWMEPGDVSNCELMRCVHGRHVQDNQVMWYIRRSIPIENSVCGDNQRCFHGRCRQEGHLLKNIGTNLCLVAPKPFEYFTPVQMIKCPRVGTPLDRLVFRMDENGLTLSAPFWHGTQSQGTHENDDKCLWTGMTDSESGHVWTDKCGDYTNPWHRFEVVPVGESTFFLIHKQTKRCLKPCERSAGSGVSAFKICDANNTDFLWTKSG